MEKTIKIRVSLAWWYRKYSKDASLGQLENEARSTRSGLWVDPELIAVVLSDEAGGTGVLAVPCLIGLITVNRLADGSRTIWPPPLT